MTQTTILAPGLTQAPSADIVVAAGAVVTVGIYSVAPAVLGAMSDFSIMQVTPGYENYVGSLGNSHRATQLNGPGTFRVRRPELSGQAFGVFKDV